MRSTTRGNGADPGTRAGAKLARIAEQLRSGSHFPITRLTVVKAACKDPATAARFVLFLVRSSQPDAKEPYQRLVSRAIREVRRCLKSAPPVPDDSFRKALADLRYSQSEIEHHRWADIRIIHSKEALLAEYALCCLAYPEQPEHWAYQAARAFAEKYDPRYGTGLLPVSAPAVESMARFWGESAS
jgi:hypothetical protein